MLTYNESNQLEVNIHPKDFSRTEGLVQVLIKKDADEIHTAVVFMDEYNVDKCKDFLRQEPKKVVRVIEMNDDKFIYSDDIFKINIRPLLDKLIKDLDTI